MRSACKRLLTGKEYQVLEAESGEEGLLVLEKRQIDVALLDLVLPGMSGLEVLQHIWQGKGKKPAVIVISGKGNMNDGFEVSNLGAAACLCEAVRAIRYHQSSQSSAAYRSNSNLYQREHGRDTIQRRCG